MLSKFDDDQRGAPHTTHRRFITRRSIRKLVMCHDHSILRLKAAGLPVDAVGLEGRQAACVRPIDNLFSALWPTKFGYHFILVLAPRSHARIHVEQVGASALRRHSGKRLGPDSH